MDRHWVCVLYSALHPPLSKFGSIATLDLESIPESTEGIRVLREWIWQACDGLLFSKKPRFEYIESFIPEFMPASMMAYDFDFERAQGYVPRTRMYRYEKWPQCLTRPGLHIKTQFIVRDFVQFLQGGQPHSLILGTLYLRCVSWFPGVQTPPVYTHSGKFLPIVSPWKLALSAMQ